MLDMCCFFFVLFFLSQMENAVNHYNSKKQLLQKSQEEMAELKRSFDVKDQEVKAIIMEKKLLQCDLEKLQTSEKSLLSKVASLEAKVGILF